MSKEEHVREILGHDSFELNDWIVEVDKGSLTGEQRDNLLASGFGIIVLPPNPFTVKEGQEIPTI